MDAIVEALVQSEENKPANIVVTLSARDATNLKTLMKALILRIIGSVAEEDDDEPVSLSYDA